MGTKQAFKTYARTQRVQDTNISFASGMNFTDAPLVEGFSRLLVNYDFGAEGNTLKPRAGLTVAEYFKAEDNGLTGAYIMAATKVTHNGHDYYQFIVGWPDSTSSLRDGMWTGNGYVFTATKTIDGSSTINKVAYELLNDYKISKCIFRNPITYGASIHGIPITSNKASKSIIGTFAFNSAYYYFTTDGKLHYTYFDVGNGTNIPHYKSNTITPYMPLQYETQNSRYNMLLRSYGIDPYTFECGTSAEVLRLTGFAPGSGTDADWMLTLSPQLGVEYDYKLWYSYPESSKEYYLRVEVTYGDDVWYPIPRNESELYTAGTDPFIIKGIKVDRLNAQFRIYACAKKDANFATDDEGKPVDTQFTLEMLAKSSILTASFSYTDTNKEKSTSNLGLTRYDLSYAKGLTYWKNRLWLFGAAEVNDVGAVQKQDSTILFASDPNRPDWFPYTAGADIFDEEIICLQPMLDELLVFTAHNLYSLTLDADGLGWTKKHLQANLNIQPWDLHLVQIVKNMVFFKSGNYFYMVVPKLTAASGAGLAIAPVSKNITQFLDNFSENVDRLIDDLYNYSLVNRFGKEKAKVTYEKELVHYYNNLDYEDVHNNYVFRVTQKTKTAPEKFLEESKLLTVSLLYNTVTRSWRVYTVESDSILYPVGGNATGKGMYAAAVYDEYEDDSLSIQLLQFDSKTCLDSYYQVVDEELKNAAAVLFPNWQYLDSGHMDQNSEMKKRFREYQFKIINHTQNGLNFYSGFFLDRATRTYEMYYTQESLSELGSTEQVTVIDAVPAEGVQGDPIDNVNKAIDTEVFFKHTKLGSWKLGVSQFPNLNNWKVRIPTSGKGYLPRLILISYNQTSYELLSCSTVYRQLYSR
jgi:hypothetical protein